MITEILLPNPISFEAIKDRFPSIPEAFIKEYITEYNKGNIIKEVVVEYNHPHDEPNLNIGLGEKNISDTSQT